MASDAQVAAVIYGLPIFNLSENDNTADQIQPEADGQRFDNGTSDNSALDDAITSVLDQSGISLAGGYLALDRDVPELPNTYSGKIITGFTVFDILLMFIILVFLAIVEDRRISKEKQPIFIPKRPVRGFRKYAVILETGHSPAGGTTSGVFIRLCGRLTKSPAFSLSWTNDVARQLFWSQNKDTFILSVPHYLGYIDSVELLTDSVGLCPPWLLKSIRVMSLDNHKCWKSNANVWLRGDRKPYSFRTGIIAGLSTREYVRNIFLQNHSWTMMWRRKLGSTFTCVQRCSLLWTSITLGMFASNYLVYRWPYGEEEQIDADTGLRVPIEKILRGDDAVSAGVLGALIGALLGMVLRILIKLMTPTRKWSRVDEKSDFTHLMSPEDLVFVEGAVVTASKPRYQGPKIPPFPPCVDSDVLKILDSLTPKQIETVKQIVNSDKYNLEDSPPDGVPEHSKDTRTSSDRKSRLGDVVSRATKSSKGRKDDKSSPWKRAKDRSNAYRGADTSSQSSANRGLKYPNPRAAVEDITTDDNSDVESIRPTKYISARDSKLSDANNNDKVPPISARFSDTTIASTATNKLDYDSLSEGESDVEAVTKRLKAAYEVNEKRRPQNVYDTAPWWDDRHKVYVSAPDAGDYHHRAVNERYERTSATETGCCRVRVESTFGEDAVLNYLEIENELPPGGVRGTFNVVAIIVSGLAFATSVAVPPFIVYQRLPLPDPYALYYLYSVILCLVFHAFVFCTADAAFCTLLATVARRRRVAKAQKEAKLAAMLRNKK